MWQEDKSMSLKNYFVQNMHIFNPIPLGPIWAILSIFSSLHIFFLLRDPEPLNDSLLEGYQNFEL